MNSAVAKIVVMLLICSNVACGGSVGNCCCLRHEDGRLNLIDCGLEAAGNCFCENTPFRNYDGESCLSCGCSADRPVAALYESESVALNRGVEASNGPADPGGPSDVSGSVVAKYNASLKSGQVQPLLQSCSFLF